MQKELLDWYKRNHRKLPWREVNDPYKIWLSEIMLQQTQVVTVIPYFEKFIKQFPSISQLANSELDTVLNLWAGLGYYSRARNLKAAAEYVVSEYDGQLPDTAEGLLELKGVGRYTAGAISSIAFDREGESLETAIRSAIADVTAAGFAVQRVEIDLEAFQAVN